MKLTVNDYLRMFRCEATPTLRQNSMNSKSLKYGKYGDVIYNYHGHLFYETSTTTVTIFV